MLLSAQNLAGPDALFLFDRGAFVSHFQRSACLNQSSYCWAKP